MHCLYDTTSHHAHHHAPQVLEKFLTTSIDDQAELTESYLVGNRLVKFLSTVLPTHKNYLDPHLKKPRTKSQAQLVELMQYLEQLALIIDEDELNKYILKDLNGSDQEMSSPERSVDLLGFPSAAALSPIQNRSTDSERSERSSNSDPSMSTISASVLLPTKSAPAVPRDRHTKPPRATWKNANEFYESQDSHIHLLQSNLSGSRELSPELLVDNTAVRGDTDYDTSRELSREFDQLVREEASSQWDARFSEFGTEHKTANQVKPYTSALANEIFVQELSKDEFVFPQQLKKKQSGFPRQQNKRDPGWPQRQKEPGFPRQEQKQPDLGSEWSADFHTQDPFQTTPPKNRVKDVQGVTSRSTRTNLPTTRPKDAGKPPPPPPRPTKSKKSSTVLSYSSPEGSFSSSQGTPTATKADRPLKHKSSPSAVFEFEEWHSADDIQPVIQVHHKSMMSDDTSSLGTHEELENQSLTSSVRKKPLRHFKGCLKCLLD